MPKGHPKSWRRRVGTVSDAGAAAVLADYQARIAALERLVGKLVLPTSLNELWADVTYIAIATRFVYLAAILDRSECDQPYSEPGQRRDG